MTEANEPKQPSPSEMACTKLVAPSIEDASPRSSMKALHLALPSLALGAATLLLLPSSNSHGYSLLGQQLGLGQRHARVFNNFADATANDNAISDPMFPGATGLELSLWKGMIEWGSEPHGDGTGDPTQGELGSGNANFDSLWSGLAAASGSQDDNIASAITGCPTGVLAFTEGPSDDGWRIRFCDDDYFFDDGPGDIPGGRYDLQSIMTHEYGHALGLGHSSISGSTMQSSLGSGSESGRSINADDRSGVIAIYGARSPSKPTICQTNVAAGVLTIAGKGFDDFNNTVWFTNKNVSSADADPRVQVTGLFSTQFGTKISFRIPVAARAGDVLVRIPGNDTAYSALSNAFPCDLLGSIGEPCPLRVSLMTPNDVPPLLPGSEQTITLNGEGFGRVTSIVLEPGIALSNGQWSIIDDDTITLDLPPTSSLGTHSLTVSDGISTSTIGFIVSPSAQPILQVGSGDALNPTSSGNTLTLVVAGSIGSSQRIYYSPSPLPSNHFLVQLMMGNGFSQIVAGPTLVIGAQGTASISMPVPVTISSTAYFGQCLDLSAGPTPRYAVSNLQSMTLVP